MDGGAVKTFIAFLALVSLAATAHAADPITLTWTPPTRLEDGNLIGTNTIVYTVRSLVDGAAIVATVTNTTWATVPFHPDRMNAWVVTAWVHGLESKPSAAYIVVPPAPRGPTGFKPK